MPTLPYYLILGVILFSLGTYGALTRKSAIQVYLAIELMFNAVNLNLIAFSYFSPLQNLNGHIFALFIITVAAIEAAVGLALILAIYRHLKTVHLEKATALKH